MSRFYFWSQSGDSMFLAMRLAREGHVVDFYVKDPSAKDLGKGLVHRVDAQPPPKGAIVVFDMTGTGHVANTYRSQGYKVIGGSSFSDEIELNRDAGTKLMKAIGIKVPETHAFKSLEEGLAFAAKNPGAWFYKPSGNQGAGMTYGAQDEQDLARFLRYAFETAKPKEGYELQKKVVGTEISFEGWWSGRKWVRPFNSTFEDKKFMTGNKGPNVGCAANVVWPYARDPKLFQKTLARLGPYLERSGYVGPIDLNMVIDHQGEVNGLEWSPRFGYDALHAWSMLLNDNAGKQLAEFASGELNEFRISNELALTLQVSVPPFPSWEYATDDVKGMPIDPRILKDPTRVFVRDVMLNKRREPALAGVDGVVCVVGATGRYMKDLRGQVLMQAESLRIPHAQYRVDPVARAERDWSRLREQHYEVPNG